jgi:hypothetical protein
VRRTALIAATALALAGCGATIPVSQATSTPAASPSSASGNGTKNLGTITVGHPTIVEWTRSGCAAFAFTSGLSGTHVIDIGSTDAAGYSVVDPGTYPDGQVISNGDWTITFVAQQ